MSLDRIKDILEKLDSGNCTSEEMNLLKEWYKIFEWSRLEQETAGEEVQAIKDRTWYAIQHKIATESETTTPSKVVSMPRNRWWLAAASILLLCSGWYFFYNSESETKASIKSDQFAKKMEIVPGGNRATLTLGDGTTIILDSAVNGNLASQGAIKVIKIDGQLSYSPASEDGKEEILFNTISTPRGGQYQIILADGSKVWLNAASTLRFPTSFIGSERLVSLTGEGYFEVAENKAKPFKVQLADQSVVEVLGTHFNVMSYSDEERISATLLEGRIKMESKKTNTRMTLMPGQQALLNENGTLQLNPSPNLEAVMAWKNEKFVFENFGLKQIMRQLERWYDIQVTFNTLASSEEYTGIISRKANIIEILKMLESTGGDRFRIQGKRVIVN